MDFVSSQILSNVSRRRFTGVLGPGTIMEDYSVNNILLRQNYASVAVELKDFLDKGLVVDIKCTKVKKDDFSMPYLL